MKFSKMSLKDLIKFHTRFRVGVFNNFWGLFSKEKRPQREGGAPKVYFPEITMNLLIKTLFS